MTPPERNEKQTNTSGDSSGEKQAGQVVRDALLADLRGEKATTKQPPGIDLAQLAPVLFLLEGGAFPESEVRSYYEKLFQRNKAASDLAKENIDQHYKKGGDTVDKATGRFKDFKLTSANDQEAAVKNAQLKAWELFPHGFKDASKVGGYEDGDIQYMGYRLALMDFLEAKANRPIDDNQIKLACLKILVLGHGERRKGLSEWERHQLAEAERKILGSLKSDDETKLPEAWQKTIAKCRADTKSYFECTDWDADRRRSGAIGVILDEPGNTAKKDILIWLKCGNTDSKQAPEDGAKLAEYYRKWGMRLSENWATLSTVFPVEADRKIFSDAVFRVLESMDPRELSGPEEALHAALAGRPLTVDKDNPDPKEVAAYILRRAKDPYQVAKRGGTPGVPVGADAGSTDDRNAGGGGADSWFPTGTIIGTLVVGGIAGVGYWRTRRWLIGKENLQAAKECDSHVKAPLEYIRQKNSEFRKALETDPHKVTSDEAKANFRKIAQWLDEQLSEMKSAEKNKPGAVSKATITLLAEKFKRIADGTDPIPDKSPDALIKEELRELRSIGSTAQGRFVQSMGRRAGSTLGYLFAENASVRSFQTNVVEGLEAAARSDADLKEALNTKPTKGGDPEIESRLRFDKVSVELKKRIIGVSDNMAKTALKVLAQRFQSIADSGENLPVESPMELIKLAHAQMKTTHPNALRRIGRSLGNAATYFFWENASLKDFRTVLGDLKGLTDNQINAKTALECRYDGTPAAERHARKCFRAAATILDHELNRISDQKTKKAVTDLRDTFSKIGKGNEVIPKESPQDLIERAHAHMKGTYRNWVRRLFTRGTTAVVLGALGAGEAPDAKAQAPASPPEMTRPAMSERAQADYKAFWDEVKQGADALPDQSRDGLANNPEARTQLLREARKSLGNNINPEAAQQIEATIQATKNALPPKLAQILAPETSGATADSRGGSEPVRTSGDASLRLPKVSDVAVSVDPKTDSIKLDVTLVGKNLIENEKVLEDVRKALDKQMKQLSDLKDPTKQEKDLLNHLKHTREKGWASTDHAERARFLETEFAERRLGLELVKGSNGSRITVLRGAGLCAGIGLIVLAAGNAVLPESAKQEPPTRSRSQ